METKLYAARDPKGYLRLFEFKPKKYNRGFVSTGNTRFENGFFDGAWTPKEMLPVVRYDNSPVELVIDHENDGCIYDSIWVTKLDNGQLYLCTEKPEGCKPNGRYLKWSQNDFISEIQDNELPVRLIIKKGTRL